MAGDQDSRRTRVVPSPSLDKTTMSLPHSERQGKNRQGKPYGVVVVVLDVAGPCASGERLEPLERLIHGGWMLRRAGHKARSTLSTEASHYC